MNNSRQTSLPSFAPLVDGLLIALAGWIAYELRWGRWPVSQDYVFVILLGTALALVLLPLSGAYHSWRGVAHWHTLGHALPGLASTAVILAVLGTLTKTTAEYSRLWMAYWIVLSFFNLFTFRWIASKLHRSTRAHRKVLIVGSGEFAANVARKIAGSPDSKREILGFVDDGRSTMDTELPAPVLGKLGELEDLVSDDIDEVWITVADLDGLHRESVVKLLQSTCLEVRFVPDLTLLSLLNHMPTRIAGMTVIELNASPLDGPNILLKTAFDKVFSFIALSVLAPLMCLIILAIRLNSPGPALFRQQRHGWDGEMIDVLKFRTMHHAASPAEEGRQATRCDPRVTGLGRWLRRTSLDELPQFINVLRGDMSVVGPRPHPVSLNESYTKKIDAYMQRHRVKPGITGWAQVNGLRGETETLDKMQKRVEYDLYYIENWSLWLDLKIILRTVTGGWMGESAY